MIRTGLRWAATLAVLVASMTMVACGDDDDGGGGSTGASTTEETKSYTIGVDLSGADDPFFVQMAEGIEEEAKALGSEVTFTYNNYDPSKELANVQDLVTKQVDGILSSPADVKAAVPAYQIAQDSDIPIMSIADHTDPEVETSFVGAPWGDFGKQIAEWTCDAAKSKGEVAMIKGPAGASFVEEMEDGYKAYMKDECPGMPIVFEVNTDLAQDKALAAAQDALTAHPDVRAIFANGDIQAAGVVQALREAKKLGDVIVTGFNGDEVGYKLVKEGTLDYTIALKPYQWGRLGMKTMVDHLNGQTAPALVRIETLPLDQSNIEDVSAEEIR